MSEVKLGIVSILLTIFALNGLANEIYFVKKGDTLSSVLHKKKLKPIYGRTGYLKKILSLNPQLSKSQGNKIYPHMKILFPTKDVAPVISPAIPLDAPIAKPEPVSHPERQPSDDFKQSFYWNISPSLSWRNLSGTDNRTAQNSKIKTLSDASYGAELLYGMHFEEDLSLYARLFIESVSFTEENDVTLSKKDFIAKRFAMGLRYKKNWLVETAMSDVFFLTSPGSAQVDIKRVMLPSIEPSYEKKFYEYRRAALLGKLVGRAYLPKDSGEVRAKLSYGVGGVLSAKLINQSFGLGYDVNLLEAKNISTDEQKIFFTYTWESL